MCQEYNNIIFKLKKGIRLDSKQARNIVELLDRQVALIAACRELAKTREEYLKAYDQETTPPEKLSTLGAIYTESINKIIAETKKL